MKLAINDVGFYISKNKKIIPILEVHNFLNKTTWGAGMPLSFVKKAIKNSEFYGIYDIENKIIGFARIIGDSATFAYLADVYISEEHRRKGYAKWLISTILLRPELQNLRRILLATRDAHGLYHKFGFESISKPQTFMEIYKPDIYFELNL